MTTTMLPMMSCRVGIWPWRRTVPSPAAREWVATPVCGQYVASSHSFSAATAFGVAACPTARQCRADTAARSLELWPDQPRTVVRREGRLGAVVVVDVVVVAESSTRAFVVFVAFVETRVP